MCARPPSAACTPPKKCDDGNECTADSCDKKTGLCAYTKRSLALCNADSDGCTINDVCMAGVCKAGKPATCNLPVGPCQRAVCASKGATSFQCIPQQRKENEKCAGGKHCKLDSRCDAKGACLPKGDDDRLWTAELSVKGYGLRPRQARKLEGGSYVVVGLATRVAHSQIKRGFHAVVDVTGKQTKSVLHGKDNIKFSEPASLHLGVQAVRLRSNGNPVIVETTLRGDGGASLDVAEYAADMSKRLFTKILAGETGDSAYAYDLAPYPGGGFVVGGATQAAGGATGPGKVNGRVYRIADTGGFSQWTWTAKDKIVVRAVAAEADGAVFWGGHNATDNVYAPIGHAVYGKLDSSGKSLWSDAVDDLKDDAIIVAVAIDEVLEDVIFAGTHIQGGVPRPLLLSLDKSDGSESFKVVGGGVYDISGATVRPGGSVVVSGLALLGGAKMAPWVASYTSDGDRSWSKTIGAGQTDEFLKVTQVPGDGLLLPGTIGDKPVLVRSDDWAQANCKDAGQCAGQTVLSCDDANPCTTDLCSAKSGCVNKLNSFQCDDGDNCTWPDKCVSGSCKAGGKVVCDDNNVCTKDSCNKLSGCTFTKLTGTPCVDNLLCTVNEKCLAGQCKTEPKKCDDGNPCTKDTCGETTDCENLPMADETPCGAHKVCLAKKCIARFAVEVSLGASHSCALAADGSMACWGERSLVGDGKTGSLHPDRTRPMKTPGLPPIKQIASNGWAQYAIAKAGGLYVWGNGSKGALGLGSKTTTHSALLVGAVKGAIYVGARGSGAAAIDANGKGYTWGGTDYGGGTLAPKLTTGTWTALAGASGDNNAFSHACGIQTGGQVYCWGQNNAGQRGTGNDGGGAGGPTTTPAKLSGLTDAVQITVGMASACALRKTGKVMCWGYNIDGGAGIGSLDYYIWKPAEVALLSDVVQVSSGDFHTCAVRKDGTAWCWGKGDRGQLGLGNTVNKNAPTQVVGLPKTVKRVGAGSYHSCAVLGDG